ncbi:MAG: nascent polypeptide-associated complex protein [Candidatus Aenigmatarchaeota archaeon]
MMPNLNPGKIQKLMKQMGMDTETIDAEEVVFHTKGGKMVIQNPDVTKVDMQGQVIFQVQGDVQETGKEEAKTEFSDEDIKTVMDQTGASEEEAKQALEEEDDLAMAVMKLKQ